MSRRTIGGILLLGLALPAPAQALAQESSDVADTQEGEAETGTLAAGVRPSTVTELLELVRGEAEHASRRNVARLLRFRQNRDEQHEMLARTERQLASEERRGVALGNRFEENERELQELQERLAVRVGNFGELFGVVRQMAGDTKGLVDVSLVSAQKPDRTEIAARIAQSTALPGLKELQALQLLLLEEMVESAQVVRFDADIADASGVLVRGEAVRVGTFNVVHNGNFIGFEPETGTLQMLPRQPARRFRQLATKLQQAADGPVAMAVDPTRGQLLGQLIQTPNLVERVQQGGYVGYTIIAMGLVGLVIALWRLLVLHRIRRGVRLQLGREQVDTGNPLGRILAADEANRDSGLDALSLKLAEAILRETPVLERYQGIIKVFAALAPLLGLLGTVVGMILTFQQLTLFGTGDPKLMAGGISQALMTTVLGLIVAIPLVLLHSLVASTSRGLGEVLEEQSVGLIARRAASKIDAKSTNEGR